VKLVDANVLLYAVNSDSEHHGRCRSWLDASLAGADTVAFAWTVLLAFLRLSTRPGLFPRPLSVSEATEQVADWLAAPSAVVVEPTAGHGRVLSQLLVDLGTGGNLVSDAHLAALAIEHRGGIVTFDRDFSRFSGLTTTEPA
jgi:toxin-antitoxin system PIN domain toxin